jgi:hypothetical protein
MNPGRDDYNKTKTYEDACALPPNSVGGDLKDIISQGKRSTIIDDKTRL